MVLFCVHIALYKVEEEMRFVADNLCVKLIKLGQVELYLNNRVRQWTIMKEWNKITYRIQIGKIYH